MRPIRRMSRIVALAVVIAVAPLVGQAAEYESRRAGHPLRIAAYALHPVGVLVDVLILRPAWWVGGLEPVRALVGRERSDPKPEFVVRLEEPESLD